MSLDVSLIVLTPPINNPLAHATSAEWSFIGLRCDGGRNPPMLKLPPSPSPLLSLLPPFYSSLCPTFTRPISLHMVGRAIVPAGCWRLLSAVDGVCTC